MYNYIFDLDGTIINSSKEVLLCFEKAFKKSGYKIYYLSYLLFCYISEINYLQYEQIVLDIVKLYLLCI